MCSYPLIIKSDKRSPGTWAVRLVKTWSLLERVQSFDNGIIISDRIVEWKMGVLLVETTRAVTKTMQRNIVRENDMELFFSCYWTIELLLAVQLDQSRRRIARNDIFFRSRELLDTLHRIRAMRKKWWESSTYLRANYELRLGLLLL